MEHAEESAMFREGPSVRFVFGAFRAKNAFLISANPAKVNNYEKEF